MREHIPKVRLSRDIGDESVVARDGVVISFFLRHSHKEVAAAIWRALETYRRAIPSEALAWYGSDDGDSLPLDEKGWARIRYTLGARAALQLWLRQPRSPAGAVPLRGSRRLCQ